MLTPCQKESGWDYETVDAYTCRWELKQNISVYNDDEIKCVAINCLYLFKNPFSYTFEPLVYGLY